jgi:hypothetical protein
MPTVVARVDLHGLVLREMQCGIAFTNPQECALVLGKLDVVCLREVYGVIVANPAERVVLPVKADFVVLYLVIARLRGQAGRITAPEAKGDDNSEEWEQIDPGRGPRLPGTPWRTKSKAHCSKDYRVALLHLLAAALRRSGRSFNAGPAGSVGDPSKELLRRI